MKAADGYYYMYQTDASYGNAHDGHGHFHARRSKDLVNWEYLGATMQEAPAWVKTKLNEIRAEQGLDPIENPSYGSMCSQGERPPLSYVLLHRRQQLYQDGWSYL